MVRVVVIVIGLCCCGANTAAGAGIAGKWGHLPMRTAADWVDWDQGVSAVVWTDLCGSGGCSGRLNAQGFGRYYGVRSSSDSKRRFTWDLRLQNGIDGSVTIDRRTYDLAAGSVLLVRVSDKGKITVKQIDRDTRAMDPDLKSIIELSKDKEIAAFFAD